MTRRLLNCQRLLGMVVTMLCLLGIAAYSTMPPRQEDPSFPYRAGMITVSYPGASAEAVERLVLQPLTDELRQVEELDWSQGTARTGVALARLKLRDRIYDTDSAWDRVRQAMERARQDFPPDDVGLMELDDRLIDIPAVVLAVGGSPSVTELSEVAERLKQNLLDIPASPALNLKGGMPTNRLPWHLTTPRCIGWEFRPSGYSTPWPGATRPSPPVASWWWKASAYQYCRTLSSRT